MNRPTARRLTAVLCFAATAMSFAQAPSAAPAPAPAAPVIVPRPPRPAPPARDPHTPGYVEAAGLARSEERRVGKECLE